MIWVLLVVALAGVTYFLTWKKDSEKLGLWRILLPVGFLLSVTIALIGYTRQETLSKETRRLNDSQLSNIQYLNGQVQILRDDNKSFLSSIGGLKSQHDTIITVIRNLVTKPTATVSTPHRQSELMEIENARKSFRDVVSGYYHTVFLFRSRNITPLRDIRIELQFSNPIHHPIPSLVGAFVIEQGTSDSLTTDGRYIFKTGYLSQANDIRIDVPSRDSLHVVRVSPSP